MDTVKISVVMSVYNTEKYLSDAIDSILGQTFSDFEFIIVNDGSTDRSRKILESYTDPRILIIDQGNTGLARALNNGIEKSKTNLIARMDADDISLPNRLQRQYEFMVDNPDVIAVGSNAINIDYSGNYVFTTAKKIYNNEIKKNLPNTPFIHPSVMFKKDAFLKAGKYCNKMVKAQDTVLFNRMAKFGNFHNIEEPLIQYRIVPSANSLRKKLDSKFFEIIKNAIYKNTISDEDEDFLRSILSNRNQDMELSTYHIFLAKKYLWNNFQPEMARLHLRHSLRIKTQLIVLPLLILSIFPQQLVVQIYNSIKLYKIPFRLIARY
ncbi:hypothetical protein DSCW_50740 [Desulfosarcina widdelii]|uniref:Glycosyltransferase 2-like domain-containing protein n=1 Tax=Desulfosarcina widdelii TaxID=947919 RepID=A0A5K7ZNA5_9BACT|nr:glycosyltransferase [Desulfosarcina widdelii]BBO77657.1 hypothetical protein DSCW_50740 [Desulfosarcina widdelii]